MVFGICQVDGLEMVGLSVLILVVGAGNFWGVLAYRAVQAVRVVHGYGLEVAGWVVVTLGGDCWGLLDCRAL